MKKHMINWINTNVLQDDHRSITFDPPWNVISKGGLRGFEVQDADGYVLFLDVFKTHNLNSIIFDIFHLLVFTSLLFQDQRLSSIVIRSSRRK